MRIVHVVENLNRGGLERVVIDLIEQQQIRGHECSVICLFEPGRLAPEIEKLGVSLIACEKRAGFDMSALLKMRSAISAYGPEVVHTHNAVAHYYAVLAGLFLGGKRINTRHGMANHPFSWKREIIYRASMFFTDMAAVVCDRARENFLKYRILPRAKAVTIYNGIPVERFATRNAAARQKLLNEAGWPQAVVVLGKVARLNPPKDHNMLLQAMALIRAAQSNARLMLIGDGPLRGELELLSQKLNLTDVVCFLGDRSDVAQLLPGFDVFVMSSTTEGYSISLLEACACALPIVATDVGGNREIVVNGTNGYLVPAKSPGKFAEAALSLIRDTSARVEIGVRNRKYAEEIGSVKAMADRYDLLYHGDRNFNGDKVLARVRET
jgi:glycosyltransferase involved in cell wall biosynthesis